MTRARDIANLVDANGDIVAGALDNVPASNDASALTTGTLAAARLPTTGVDASSLSTGTLAAARLPSSGVDASSLTTGTLDATRIANASLPSAKLSTSPISFDRSNNITLLSGFNTTYNSSTRIVHYDLSSAVNSNTIGVICSLYFQYNASANLHGYCNGYFRQDGQSSSFNAVFNASHFDWYYNVYQVEMIVPWDGTASNQYLDVYTTYSYFTSSQNTYNFYYRGRIDRG